MGFLFRKRNEPLDDMTSLVIQAQVGNQLARETLLKEYTPFILRVASNCCNRYLVMGEDDEASIGLLAFNEAIDKFSEDKGAKFLTFAEVVIKRRLTDFYRKEKKYINNVLPLSNFENEENPDQDTVIEVQEANKVYELQEEAFFKKQEILLFSKLLADFEISLKELVQLSPKHHDARVRAYEVAQVIVDNKELLSYLIEKKSLPLKKIAEQVNVSRKTLERQRKYIIAIVLILNGKFEYLKDYISGLGREGTA